MKQIIIILILGFSSVSLKAQEKAFQIKVKKEWQKMNGDFTESSEIKKIKSKHSGIIIKQTYPNAKNPELGLYYDVIPLKGHGKVREDFIQNDNIEKMIETEDLQPLECKAPVSVNDAYFLYGWSGCNSLELIEGKCAWSITRGNPSIVVAVIDEDFCTEHEDLKNQLVYVSVSDPQNGAIHGHGTRVAGSVSAEVNNGKGIAGIGYNTKIAGYWMGGLPSSIWTAYQHGRKIINVSWTGTGLTQAAAREITEGGSTIVVGAGNDNDYEYHSDIANIPGVIVVSGVSQSNNHGPTGSAHNQYVDLCAPYDVEATWYPNNYGFAHGTSHSSPIVAGTIGLMLAVNPSLTPAQIEIILKQTADPINDASSFPGQLGAGKLNAYKAVKAACTKSISGTYASNNIIEGCYISANGIKVTNYAYLLLIGSQETVLYPGTEVALGSKLEIRTQ